MSVRLCISNLAWPFADDNAALQLVGDCGFEGVEIAPSKVFGSLDAATREAVDEYRRRLSAYGLEVAAMQAILFGVEGAHLFESSEARSELARRLTQVAVLAGHMGGVCCVFGAPRLRDPGTLDPSRAFEIAVRFFSDVARIFAANGATLCFEANPAAYGCRFITRTDEAARLVEAVGIAGFALQFDTGTQFMNGELIRDSAALMTQASHFHISEPHLAPVGGGDVDHSGFAASRRQSGYSGWLSVEMKETSGWEQNVLTAALTARRYI